MIERLEEYGGLHQQVEIQLGGWSDSRLTMLSVLDERLDLAVESIEISFPSMLE